MMNLTEIDRLRADIMGTLEHLCPPSPIRTQDWPGTEAAVGLALRVLGRDGPAPIEKVDVCDSAGQKRGVYQALLRVCRLRMAEPVLHWPSDGTLVGTLWRGWGLRLSDSPTDNLWQQAFAHQKPAGHLHELTGETCLDAFVYDELSTLHAAAAWAVHENDETKLAQVLQIARYHCANTQPDNTTNQPWGLAAFAIYDDTRTFALQQLHDTRTWLANRRGRGGTGLALGLLADAWITLRHYAERKNA